MIRKRFLSAFLILALLVSLLAGSLSVFAASSTINTGTRHELCEALSADAEKYYTGSNTWENLSALEGIETDNSVKACGSDLFNALHNLMWNTLTNTVSYKSLTSYWSETDRSGGSSDASLIYADAISSSYNREHVWPKSHGNFYESGAGSDLHHLRPSDSTINSTRGHWTFGNAKQLCTSYNTKEYGGRTVLWYNSSYSGNDCLGLVEIKDDVKGDVARILLYVYVTYGKATGENLNLFTKTAASGSGNNANTGDKIIYDLDTLLEWCEIDPVDTWEMSRNDCCAAVQGNRNVFIDYPEFAWLLFGQDVPDMDTPSGMAHEMQGGSSFTVTAASADESMGTVTGSGRSFTAVPAEGYYVSGYTLEPEDAATVTQNGNDFRVSKPTEDCTLTVIFAAKTPATLSFSVPTGVSCKAIDAYAGDNVTLPTPNGKPTGDYEYTFKGWVALTYDNVTEKPAAIYPAGSVYTLNGSSNLYALYTYTVGGTGSSTEFTRITTQDELTNGTYVFTSSATGIAMATNVGSNWVYPGGTYTGETIDTPAAADIWEYNDGRIFYTGGALACNGAKSISLSDEGTPWTLTVSGGVWTLVSNDNTMSFNNTGWRPYGNGGYGNDKTFNLYKGGSGGTTYYTTVIGGFTPIDCTHDNTEIRDAVEPTCTETGYSGDVWCLDCGELVEEGIVLEMTDHHYVDGECIYCGAGDPEVEPCNHENTELTGAVEPTCTEPGYTGDIWCLDCHEQVEEGTVIAALGHDYVDGICSRCGDEDPTWEPPVPADPCESYTDINREAWYHPYADYVIKEGLMGSTTTEALTFEPDIKVSRSMVASILYRIAGNDEEAPYQGTFTDVKDGKWYTTAIEWCAKNGLASGKGNGIFDPNGNVTRQELAVFMYKLAEFLGRDVTGRADMSGFADAKNVPAWSKDYLAWAVDAGIISGQATGDKTYLNPTAGAMRSELASILTRFFA